MDKVRATWSVMLGDRISVTRMGGYGLLWLWTIMMFSTLVPYSLSPEPRTTLYAGFTLSLATMVATMLFIAVAAGRGAAVSENRFICWVAAGAMAAGSVICALGDPGTSWGMLLLTLGAVMTGSGSAALFVCWGEQFFGIGGRVALVELAIGSCGAFMAGFALHMMPHLAATALTVAAPLGSAALLVRGRGAGSDGPGPVPAEAAEPLSRQTLVLLGKTLAGSALVGGISGFFDVLGGYNTHVVTVDIGMYLLLAGFMATLLLSLIAVFCLRDGVFYAYRFSVLVLCLGCLVTPFLTDGSTYFSTLVFAGYTCYTIILYILCIDVSTSFRLSVARCLGLGFVALYGGEIAGQALAYNLPGEPTAYGLALMTIAAVSILLVAHLFLFTEVDLVKLGIGEVSLAVPGSEEEAAEVAADPAPLIVERCGLTPRESDVLPLLLEGRTIQRIQETLYISAGTVSTHIRHIYQKTGCANRQELIDLSQQITAEGNGDHIGEDWV